MAQSHGFMPLLVLSSVEYSVIILWSQSNFCKVYKVKDGNMKKLECASFPMVCGPMFLWSGPPGATKVFNLRIKGGTTVKK